MDLILWRHAEAQPARDDLADLDRRLTAQGERQARRMGLWLQQHLPAEQVPEWARSYHHQASAPKAVF